MNSYMCYTFHHLKDLIAERTFSTQTAGDRGQQQQEVNVQVKGARDLKSKLPCMRLHLSASLKFLLPCMESSWFPRSAKLVCNGCLLSELVTYAHFNSVPHLNCRIIKIPLKSSANHESSYYYHLRMTSWYILSERICRLLDKKNHVSLGNTVLVTVNDSEDFRTDESNPCHSYCLALVTLSANNLDISEVTQKQILANKTGSVLSIIEKLPWIIHTNINYLSRWCFIWWSISDIYHFLFISELDICPLFPHNTLTFPKGH